MPELTETWFVLPIRPYIAVNTDPVPYKNVELGAIAAFKGQPRNIKADISRQGNTMTMKFSHPIAQNRNFRRGLVKMAMGLVALKDGSEQALSQCYQQSREYVLGGSTQPRIWFSAVDSGDPAVSLYEIRNIERAISAATIKIFGVFFFVELFEDSVNQRCIKKLNEITSLTELNDL